LRLNRAGNSPFLLKSAIADYEANRIEEARRKLLEVSANSGRPDPRAFEYLYLISKYEEPTDLAAAEVWCGRFVEAVKELAHAGSIEWQLKLATMCQFGDRVPVDQSYALATIAKLADSGSPEAQYRYATMQKHGQCGLVADQEAYVQWLEVAANNGFGEAQHEFALLLLSGDHVTPADRAKALTLLRKASDGGNAQAKLALAELGRA
jgi:TPR repeat protein